MGRNSVCPSVHPSICKSDCLLSNQGVKCQLLRYEGLPEGPEGLSEGSEGLPEELEGLSEGSKGISEGSKGMPEGPESLKEGPATRAKRGTDEQTYDGCMDGWTEFLRHLQEFVPYRSRCPKSKLVLIGIHCLFK